VAKIISRFKPGLRQHRRFSKKG